MLIQSVQSENFEEQIKKIQQKGLMAMNMLKFLRGTWWGTDPQTLLMIYKSYIRSIIDYAGFIYFPWKKTETKKLEKVQHSAIRLALGYRMSTPLNVLLGESKLQTLADRVKYLGSNFIIKALSHWENPLCEIINDRSFKRKKTMRNLYRRQQNREFGEHWCCMLLFGPENQQNDQS